MQCIALDRQQNASGTRLVYNTIQYNIRLMHRSQTATTSNMKHMNIEHEIQLPSSGNVGIKQWILVKVDIGKSYVSL